MLLSIRLTNENLQELKQHVQHIESDLGIQVHAAGYECFSISKQQDIAQHVHVLVTTNYTKDTIYRKLRKVGYGGNDGNMSYNVRQSKHEILEALQYHCKGHARGEYVVEFNMHARTHHDQWWDLHEKIERRQQTHKQPVYRRAVEYIEKNISDFREYNTGTLDTELVLRKILEFYGDNMEGFTQQNVEKTYNLLRARLDRDRMAEDWAYRYRNTFEKIHYE